QVLDFGPFPGNSAELGVLLVTNGDRGGGFRGGAVADSEAIVLVTQASAGYVRTIIGN
ncbi:MAG: hypothetical protein GWM88_15500, partial [Pseudomonadales bacterium]|nr:hypothetical protein [Pseudomonadales bacterium]NIX09342.1 hypothetical protein [Pseudomonadales bacterium]